MRQDGYHQRTVANMLGGPSSENQDDREFSPEENRAGVRAGARARVREETVDCMALPFGGLPKATPYGRGYLLIVPSGL